MADKFIPLNDAEKKLLSDRYLDLKFEQDIDDFVCVRCDRLAIVHFFTNCGHLLCLNCKRIIDNGGLKCRQCNAPITDASEQRDEFERRLLALRTKCPNTKYGCQLTTNLAQIPEHVGVCEFTREQVLLASSTGNNTTFNVIDKINEMNGHIAELKIGFHKMNEHIEALETFKEDWKEELLGLRSDVLDKINETNGQIVKLEIGATNMNEHTEAFKAFEISLKTELKGLQTDIEARELKGDKIQLKKEIAGEIQMIETNLKKLLADELKTMKEEIILENSTMKKEVANINNKIKDLEQKKSIEEFLKHKPSMDKLLDSFLFGSAEEKMVFESLCLKWTIKDKDIVIPTEVVECDHVSDIFPVYGFQPKAQLKLIIDSGGVIILQLCFLDEAREGQEVAIKPLPMVSYIIKDLSGYNSHLITYKYHSFKQSLKYNQFGYGIGLFEHNWRPLVSPGAGSVELLVLVEPMTIIIKPLSVDGTITDTIEHYSRKLEMAEERLIRGHWSPPFLTHAGGYRVAVEMGLDKSIGLYKRGLVAGIRFLSGESDSELESEFAHETSVTLINQWDARKNITVKRQAKEAYDYYMSIATHDAMGSGGFLVNDSLTYHVTVKPIK